MHLFRKWVRAANPFIMATLCVCLSGCGLDVTYRRLLNAAQSSDSGLGSDLWSGLVSLFSAGLWTGGEATHVFTAVAPDGSFMITAGTVSDSSGSRWVIRKYSGAGFGTIETIENSSNIGGLFPWGGEARAVAIAPDSSSFVVVGSAQDYLGTSYWVVRRYSGAGFATATTIEASATLGSDGADARSVSFSPDGLSFVVAGSAQDSMTGATWLVRLYSGAGFATMTTLENDGAIGGGTTAEASAVAFTPDGASIVAGGYATLGGGQRAWFVRLYGGAGFATKSIIENDSTISGGTSAEVTSIAVSPDGTYVAAGGFADDGAGNINWVLRHYSGAGYLAGTAMADNRSGISGGTQARLQALAFAPDGLSIVAAGQTFDGANNQHWAVLRYTGAGFMVATTLEDPATIGAHNPRLKAQSVSFLPSGAAAFVGGYAGDYLDYAWIVRRYGGAGLSTATTVEAASDITSGKSARARAVAFAPDGLSFVAVGSGRTDYTWIVRHYSGTDFATETTIENTSAIVGGSTAHAAGVAFAPDGLSFIVVGYAQTAGSIQQWVVRRYSGAGFATITTIEASHTIADPAGVSSAAYSVAFAPDGLSFVVAGVGMDATVTPYWAVRRYSGAGFATMTTIEVSNTLGGGTFAVAYGVAFAPDGLSFVVVGTAYTAGFASAWTVRQYSGAGFATKTMIESSASVSGVLYSEATSVSFAPDGSSFAVAGWGYDGADRKWLVRHYGGAGFATISALEASDGIAGGMDPTAYGVSFSPDGQFFLVAGEASAADGNMYWVVKRYRGAGFATIDTLEESMVIPNATISARASCVQVSPDGTWYLAGGQAYDSVTGDTAWVVQGSAIP